MGFGLIGRLRAVSPALADLAVALQEKVFAVGAGGRRREEVFSEIVEANLWGNSESVSGSGSTLDGTAPAREALARLLSELRIRSMVDVPCGDCNWMKSLLVEGIVERYLGLDIVASLVERNRSEKAISGVTFAQWDLCQGPPPRSDLVLCRDLVIHLPLSDAQRALANLAASGAPYLVLGSYRGVGRNREILTGQWRPLDLEKRPFGLSRPRWWAREGVFEIDGEEVEKGLGLWTPEELVASGFSPPGRLSRWGKR